MDTQARNEGSNKKQLKMYASITNTTRASWAKEKHENKKGSGEGQPLDILKGLGENIKSIENVRNQVLLETLVITFLLSFRSPVLQRRNAIGRPA